MVKIFKYLIAMMLLMTTFPGHAAQTLVLNSTFYAPLTSPDQTGVLDQLYKELARRLGIEIVIQALPAERALINANLGIEDGDVCRVIGLEKKYPNLIRVPEAVMRYQMSVFTRGAHFTVAGPASLKPYDVGIVTGWKILEKNSTLARSVSRLENGEQLFSMLEQGRIDVAIFERMQGTMLIKQLGLHDVHRLQPSFLEGDWYLYLNKQHAAMVPMLAAELKKMKQDGTHKRIFDAVLGRYAR